MLFPRPFAEDILDSGAFGRSTVQSTALSNFLSVVNSYISSCQITDNGNGLTITSPVSSESALKFVNSGASGSGGRIFQIESSIAGTTGTLPFLISALEFAVNDDSSQDYCVLMGHGFAENSTLAAGAQWGASGIKFEQHYNPSGGTNQSESYFIHVSRRISGGNQEYRGFSITHVNHDRTDGTDTLLCGISADTIQFQDATFVQRGVWIDSGLSLSAGQTFSLAGAIVTWNGTTGLMTTTAIKNQYGGTIATDDDNCILLAPTVDITSKVASAMRILPAYTSMTTSNFFGIQGFMPSNKAAAILGFAECDVGSSGAGIIVTRAFGYRARVYCTAGQVVLGHGFWAQSPATGGTLSTCYGVKIDDHTGFHAIQTGTGKHVFGDATANTLIGFHAATPVVQYTTTGTVTGFTAGAGTAARDDSTYTGNTGTKAYTVGDIVRALKLLGLIASS